jgi:hypothetical protein
VKRNDPGFADVSPAFLRQRESILLSSFEEKPISACAGMKGLGDSRR